MPCPELKRKPLTYCPAYVMAFFVSRLPAAYGNHPFFIQAISPSPFPLPTLNLVYHNIKTIGQIQEIRIPEI